MQAGADRAKLQKAPLHRGKAWLAERKELTPGCVFTSAVVNQDGQPLMEGKLKEKQVRWKFIKRWKTRYFTLAGNQLLFRKGKSVSQKNVSLIPLFPSSASPFPRGFHHSAFSMGSVHHTADSSQALARRVCLCFSCWIRSVRLWRGLSVRLAVLLCRLMAAAALTSRCFTQTLPEHRPRCLQAPSTSSQLIQSSCFTSASPISSGISSSSGWDGCVQHV